jgi:CheY-like chemotaxis protein
VSEAAPSGRARPGAPSGAARIVICDDDPGVRRFIADYLRATGHAVHEANDALEALRLIDQTAADLLIVEYSMPLVSGTELVRRAQHRRFGLRALLITGQAGDADADPDAAIAILRKPFGAAELGRKVGEILGEKTSMFFDGELGASHPRWLISLISGLARFSNPSKGPLS